MTMIAVNGVDLDVEEHGAGAPILGIHGTPSSASLWSDAGRRLGAHGRCIVYERRGFPRSGPAEGVRSLSLSEHVADAAALLEKWFAAPAIVVGRSTGGLIALDLAVSRPDLVRALVLLEPAAFTLDPEAQRTAERLRGAVLAAAESDPGRAAETVLREALGDTAWENLPSEVKELFAAASPAVLAETRGKGLDSSEEPKVFRAEDLSAVRVPTLLVSAADSPRALHRVADRLAEALPGAERAEVPGGHLIDPADPVVLDFVDRIVASSERPRSG